MSQCSLVCWHFLVSFKGCCADPGVCRGLICCFIILLVIWCKAQTHSENLFTIFCFIKRTITFSSSFEQQEFWMSLFVFNFNCCISLLDGCWLRFYQNFHPMFIYEFYNSLHLLSLSLTFTVILRTHVYFFHCPSHLVFFFFPVLIIQLCVPKIKHTHTQFLSEYFSV